MIKVIHQRIVLYYIKHIFTCVVCVFRNDLFKIDTPIIYMYIRYAFLNIKLIYLFF